MSPNKGFVSYISMLAVALFATVAILAVNAFLKQGINDFHLENSSGKLHRR